MEVCPYEEMPYEEAEAFIDKYDDDPKFRLEVGPNIGMYGDSGYGESLVGLQINVDFGYFGVFRGVVAQDFFEELQEDHFRVVWTCGATASSSARTTSLTTCLSGTHVLAWYYLGRDERDIPPWFTGRVEKSAAAFVSELAAAPAGTELVSFQFSYDEEFSEPLLRFEAGSFESRQEKWSVTMSRLNDPPAAAYYGNNYYPLSSVLLTFALCRHLAPSCMETLPAIVSEENRELFALADKYSRLVYGSSHHQTGYGQLIALEKIVKKIFSLPFPSGGYKKKKDWKEPYLRVQALILTLSSQFEEENGDWEMANDPERIDELVINVRTLIMRTMCYKTLTRKLKVEEAIENRLKKDRHFNMKHIRAGSFVLVESSDEFIESNPGPALCWKGYMD